MPLLTMKKFYNHILRNVDPAKMELTLDMWGNNGWEAYAVVPTAGKWTVFLKRERITTEES